MIGELRRTGRNHVGPSGLAFYCHSPKIGDTCLVFEEVSSIVMRNTALGIALLLLPLSLLVNGQNPEWQAMKTQKLFAFDPDCADKVSFPKQALGKTVQEAIPRKDRGRPEDTNGDLA